MSEVNPFAPAAKCDVCKESYPQDLIQPYVNEKSDKKGNVQHERLNACPLCVADMAGKRAGLKTPYDFSADAEMSKKIAYAQHIKEQRETSSKTAALTSDDDAAKAAEAEKQRLADEEAQRQLDEEEAERQRLEAEQNTSSEETTDMLETEESTSLEEDTTSTGRRKRGSN